MDIHPRWESIILIIDTHKARTNAVEHWSRTAYTTMMTSSNGSIFRVTGHLCREFTGPGEFPAQRPVTRSFDVFFDLRLHKRLSKQPWGWWFETLSWSLWRHWNVPIHIYLAHWGRNKMSSILQTTILNAFLRIKVVAFWFKLHRN